MKPHTQALRVGLFLVLGLALLVVAIAVVLGGQVFTPRDRVVMRFTGSVYGLQVGAPVVFRGVNIGWVVDVGLARNSSGEVVIPVQAALDQRAVNTLGGTDGMPMAADQGAPLQALLAQGLSARLATQSLLTGLLYVDLDLRPALAAQPSAANALPGSTPDIPTLPTTIQALQAQLEGLDIKAALQDLTAIAAATRQLLADPNLPRTLGHAAELTAELRTLTQQLQRQVAPLSGAAQATLTDTRQAAQALGQAADRFAQTAQRIDAAVAADSPLILSFQRAAGELATTAASLRGSVGDDAELVRNLDRAAQDVARAARHLSELTRLLERQPDALLRGRELPP
jgi:paraquat-inducible protein B